MAIDAAAVATLVKEMTDANAAGKSEDVIRILKKLNTDVDPSEELLKATRAGQAVGKLRNSSAPGISTLAKDIVKRWKEVIESKKTKRKRDEESDIKKEDGVAKKAKTEGGSSKADSPATPNPESNNAKSESKPRLEPVDTKSSQSASSPKKRSPLSTIDSTRKEMRTATTDNMVKFLKVDSEHGDDIRDKSVVLLYNSLAGDSNAENKVLKERSLAIEKQVWLSLNHSTGNDYRSKIRSLFLNLKDKGNPALRNEIVLGDISPETVVSMSKEEMASESVRALNAKIAKDNLFKAKAVGETQAETDAFKCGRCGQRKCTYYQMQTRSADEPMTTFVTCTNCNNRWKFS